MASLLEPTTGPALGWISGAADKLSVSVVKELGQAYNDYPVAVGHVTTNSYQGSAFQTADAHSSDNAVVTTLAPLSPTGSAVTMW